MALLEVNQAAGSAASPPSSATAPSDSGTAPSASAAAPAGTTAAPGATGTSRLPLPLVVFERYLLTDDHPRHPMTYQVRLLCAGTIDEAAFERAVKRALQQHPLFTARVQGAGRARRWIAPPSVGAWIDFGPAGQPFDFPGEERIAIERNCPTRIWVRSGAEQVEIRMQMHHACADGLGAYQFLEDALASYDLEIRGAASGSRLRDVDQGQLAQRDRFGLDWKGKLRRLPAEIWGLIVGMLMFFAARPVVLARRSAQPPAEDGRRLLDQPTYHFTGHEFAELKAAARRDGATLNDLLLTELYRAIQTWQRACGTPLGSRLVRIMVPVDLRTPSDDRLPAANVVAMVNLDRRPGWIGNWRRALRLVSWETWFLKRFRFGLSFIRGLAFCERLPGGLTMFCRPNRAYATAVLSNLGKVLEGQGLVREDGKVISGGMCLEAIESAPPVRAGTAVGVSILSYAGRLSLVLSYDRWHWSHADAQAFLETYVEALRSVGQDALNETATKTARATGQQ